MYLHAADCGQALVEMDDELPALRYGGCSRSKTGTPSMLTVTSTEFRQNVGRYEDEALRQPVAITRDGQERLVVLSAEEYRRLRLRWREVLRAGNLSDDDLAAIAGTEMDPRHDHLDSLLD
jgi:PHD/YefM family antitoxin component YafN of YafNO toxin-antitoxin module